MWRSIRDCYGQVDRVGRIFTHDYFYFGYSFGTYKSRTHFGLLLATVKVKHKFLQNGLGYVLADFFYKLIIWSLTYGNKNSLT
jgi:hypothetical protein